MPFQQGVSGNPAGRAKGMGSRQQIFNDFVLPHKKELIEKALLMAKEGDPQMLKLFLERMLPAKPTDDPVQIDLPAGDFSSTEKLEQLGLETMRAVTAGEITPEDASRIACVLKAHQGTFQLLELQESFKQVFTQIEEQNKQTASQLNRRS